ncbi:universal stress protein [Zeaxanthinibacter enoshimensis]|uniref:universal stress protein n=1 Tax=Zeaxanthinibacter enoshimensis TaxID=392009 RepID=UPI00356716E5
MKKRILLPTDFSKNSLNAARYALDLYHEQECDFYLLNVYQRAFSTANMSVPETGEPGYESQREKSEDGLRKFGERLKLHGENPKHRIHMISTFNSVYNGIEDSIAKKDIDLVVMGTKGVRDVETSLFGTITVNVMEQLQSCPVLAVPDNVRFCSPKVIAFPTDYKSEFKRRELHYMLDIARDFGSFIHVVHIKREARLTNIQESNKKLLDSILDGLDHQFHELEKQHVHRAIGKFIDDNECDLVAFTNRKHGLLASIFDKPLIQEAGYHYKIPILALNDHR